MYVATTTIALCALSMLNGAQERICGITSTARTIVWSALGYQLTPEPTFHELIKNGSFESIQAATKKWKELRDACENFNPFYEENEEGKTPILIAAERGDADIVLLLLQSGSSATESMRNTRTTPLHIAAQHGHMDAACLLLRAGADINAQDAIKNTALHYAFKHGHNELATYFINCCRADPRIQNRDKKTPFACRPTQSPVPVPPPVKQSRARTCMPAAHNVHQEEEKKE